MTKIHLTYEFESDEELRAHLAAEPVRAATPTPAPQATPTIENTTAPEAGDEPTRDSTDGDGMPYDEAVHADPPQFTQDGLWRAKRGKADEAKAARAAFKAGGGDVEPPAEVPAAPSMPGAMPSALPADAPEPVSLERLIERINVMITRNEVDEDALSKLYAEHSGVSASESFGVFQTNETARANLFAALDALRA